MNEDIDAVIAIIRKLTKRQRLVFDAVCVGIDSGHPRQTLQSLERKGLIEGRDVLLPGRPPIVIRRYSTPLPVHYLWSVVCSDEITKEAERRGITVDEYEAILIAEG